MPTAFLASLEEESLPDALASSRARSRSACKRSRRARHSGAYYLDAGATRVPRSPSSSARSSRNSSLREARDRQPRDGRQAIPAGARPAGGEPARRRLRRRRPRIRAGPLPGGVPPHLRGPFALKPFCLAEALDAATTPCSGWTRPASPSGASTRSSRPSPATTIPRPVPLRNWAADDRRVVCRRTLDAFGLDRETALARPR